MNNFINNLPKLTTDEHRRKNAGSNGITVKDNFTVKRCPLMDNFETMDPNTMWKPLSGSPIIGLKDKPKNIEAFREKLDINKLPNIQGIHLNNKKPTDDEDADDEDADDDMYSMFFPDKITNVYIGSLTIVGLFILFRVVNRSK